MKTINSALRKKQQKRILHAAQSCFAKNSLAQTTMRDIAAKADMSLGNIYRYFKNKEQLIKAFVENDGQELHDAFLLLENTRHFRKTLLQIAKEYIADLSQKHTLGIYFDIMSEALRNPDIANIIELDKAEKTLENVLKNSANLGRIELSTTPDIAALAIISFIENAAIKCAFNANYSVNTAVKQFKITLDLYIKVI